MKKLVAAALAAVMAMSLAACGGSGSSSSSSGSATSGSSAAETQAVTIAEVQNVVTAGGSVETTAAPEKVIDESKSREIVVSTPNEPKRVIVWDPEGQISNYDAPFIYHQFETPFKLNPDGSMTGILAKDYEWSEDYLTLTVHFKDNVYFSNGDHMTAEDAAWSINQICSTAAGAQYYPNMTSCEAVNDTDMVLKFEKPYPAVVTSFVHRMSLVYDKKYYEEVGMEGYTANPVGTGPYIRTENVLGDHQTMELREDYWDKDNMPFYKKVTVKFLTDANAQMLALENGEVDVLLQASIGPFLKLPADSPIGYSTTSASSIMGMVMNMLWGPTAKKEFRQALQYAINRDELNLGVYENLAKPVDMFGCSLFISCPDEGTYTGAPGCDPDKAKELLQACGYNGEEYILAVQSGTKAELAAQIIQGELMNVGINCKVTSLDSASVNALVATAEGWSSMIRSMNNSVMDMSGSISLSYSYDFRIRGGRQAAVSVRDDEYEEAIVAAQTIADPEERKLAYAALVSKINEEAWYIPLLQEFNVTGYNKRVEGVRAYPFNGIIYFGDLY